MYRVAFVLVASLCFACCHAAGATKPPQVLVPGWQIELIAVEPNLVTPTGCCFDSEGRLLVIECHTHFPPDDYAGPKTDRIFRFDDSDGDGVLDRSRLFHSGTSASMNIVALADGAFALATRSAVLRLCDQNNDGSVDQQSVILKLETAATYPHNGLAGLTLGPDGWLYVGQGENFGEPYELIGTDGSKQIGGGEGGNVFRCRPDGSQVQRVATGFWNPFGLCFDNAKRLWGVGNDPDSMPPNRLMHIVDAADFGFQFRFGRAGVHPLLAWDGELPGTMPMASGTGEAICGLLPYGDALLASSWGDNRIERYELVSSGASFSSGTQVVVQGDADFRPVGMALAPDQSIYLTDWVDRSYPVHGKGRLWRLSRIDADGDGTATLPVLSNAEQQAAKLRGDRKVDTSQRLAGLESEDPFIRQAAIAGLVATKQLRGLQFDGLGSPAQQVGVLIALRWQELVDPDSISPNARQQLLEKALQSDSDDVLLTAVRWATERRCVALMPTVRQLLTRDPLTPQLFSAVVAAVAYMESGSAAAQARDPAIETLLIEMLSDASRKPSLRALALRRLSDESQQPTSEQLHAMLVATPTREFGTEVVRFMDARRDESASSVLQQLSVDASLDVETRADALACLAREADQYHETIASLTKAKRGPLRAEAERILSDTALEGDATLPPKEDLKAWTAIVARDGNVDAGRRVFFRTQCAACHQHSGRGANTGPDLTSLAQNTTVERIIESILQPSKEIAPMYVSWQVVTTDGAVLTGLKLNKSGVGRKAIFQAADGTTFVVQNEDIELQRPLQQSIMPAGLEQAMSLQELKDLVAFLTSNSKPEN